MPIETTTTLELTDEETVLLRETLAEYLSDLRAEIAGTDVADFRERLQRRLESWSLSWSASTRDLTAPVP